MDEKVEMTFRVDAEEAEMLLHAYLLIERQYGIRDVTTVAQVADTVNYWVDILEDAGYHPCPKCGAEQRNKRKGK